MKLHRLIKENIDVNRVDLKLLNYLHKNSISKNSTDIYKTLNRELHIDDKDVISRVIKLYKNNEIGDDEIYDESIDWVVPSENDYSDEVRAIAQSLNVDPELFVFRGINYDLEIYNYIPNNNLYEVGTYNDLVRSIREKMFQTEFSGYSIWMLEKYIKLNEEILDYNITEIIEEEITNMSPYEMLNYLVDNINDFRENPPPKEDIINIYTHYRYEEIYEDYMTNPYDYIRGSELTIEEAIEENVIEFDVMGMVKEMISNAIKSDNLKVENINNQSYFIVIGFNAIF